ncbi:hypothetical protein AXG93_2817s1110 [Marchantia polymorpha subsp. ruderalis]|uniref:Uncharacterized protein n=1 Tax=Marchantia polymorpha subsp. ruderalis TaxID=1480154 RepID=A0A176W529_MARPO|nr:hypothetical protein AXG93_2817s1110 [Marchantia polymorpha subsp. ruderalis]
MGPKDGRRPLSTTEYHRNTYKPRLLPAYSQGPPLAAVKGELPQLVPWLREKNQLPRGYRPHPERWQVSDWEQVLGRCEGKEGNLLFECESVHVSKEEEISFGALFKKCKSRKNGYKTRDYVDRKRKNVAVALLQILQPHRITYMTSWQASGKQQASSTEAEGTQAMSALLFIGRAAVTRNSPSSEEDVSAEVLGRSTDLPAQVLSEETRRPSGHRGRHAATARMPAMKRCLPSEQVPFDDSPLGQGPSAQAPSTQQRFREEPSAQGHSAQGTSGQTPSAQTASAQKPLVQVAAGEGRDGETRVPSAQAPSAIAVRAGVAGLLGADSPTLLEVLAGHGVAAAAEEATRLNARDSPRISSATEILATKDDTPSEEEEVESVPSTPTGVLCEQVVPLLRYLDCKAIKYRDPRHRGSYVELVRNRTRIKVATTLELIALDQKYLGPEIAAGGALQFLQEQYTISRKLQKTAI